MKYLYTTGTLITEKIEGQYSGLSILLAPLILGFIKSSHHQSLNRLKKSSKYNFYFIATLEKIIKMDMTSTKRDTLNVDGRLIFLKTATDTNGELLEMEAVYTANSSQPPAHYHPFQDEKFKVLTGSFRVNIDGVEQVYETGDQFVVPKNTLHWMHNVSDQSGRLNWQVRPAMRTELFLSTMWQLQADGKTNQNGVPPILHLAVILHEFRSEFRASSPPYWIQEILFSFLAPIGRLLGYDPTYLQTEVE